MMKASLLSHNQRLKEKLVCTFMRHGKKASSRKIVNDAFEFIALNSNKKPDLVFLAAVANAAPPMSLRSMKRGARNLKVPFPITEEQRHNLGVRYIVESVRAGKTTTPSFRRMANEILSAAENKGSAVEKRKRISKDIEDNRGNVFMRWA